MTNSLEIGQVIYQILNQSGINNVYPLVADEGTTFPFVAYRRVGLRPASTKDRYNYSELAVIDLLVASSDYKSGIKLATKIKHLLEHTRGIFNGINIGEITLADAQEDYIDNTFIQKLTLNIEILWQ